MNEMINSYFEEKTEIVVASRKDREDSILDRSSSKIFYNLIKKTSFPEMPTGGFDYALVGRNVINLLAKNTDANPFWQGEILWTGYPIKFIPYKRSKRLEGSSKWSLAKKIKLTIDGIMAFSYIPLRTMSVLGILVFLSGICYALFIAGAYINGAVPFKGWAPIMILILVFSGIIMLMLGVIGEYLWRVLDQTRNIPGYIIESDSKIGKTSVHSETMESRKEEFSN